jgi:hypothetical protein
MKKIPSYFILILILLATSMGCAATEKPSTGMSTAVSNSVATPAPTATSTPDPRIQPIEGSMATTNSLDELIKSADTIVIGRMTGIGEIINIARDVNDVTKPSSSIFVVGQVYHVIVESYLKSQGPKAIKVVQPEGFLIEAVAKTPENIARARQVSRHIPVRAETKYLFFLYDMKREFPGQNYYVGITLQPNRFTLPEQWFAEPESQWEDAKNFYKALAPNQLTDEIEFKVTGQRPTRLPPIPPASTVIMPPRPSVSPSPLPTNAPFTPFPMPIFPTPVPTKVETPPPPFTPIPMPNFPTITPSASKPTSTP